MLLVENVSLHCYLSLRILFLLHRRYLECYNPFLVIKNCGRCNAIYEYPIWSHIPYTSSYICYLLWYHYLVFGYCYPVFRTLLLAVRQKRKIFTWHFILVFFFNILLRWGSSWFIIVYLTVCLFWNNGGGGGRILYF